MRKLKRYSTVSLELTAKGFQSKDIVLNECPWLEMFLQELKFTSDNIEEILIKLKLRSGQIEQFKKYKSICYKGEKYFLYLSTPSDMKKNQCILVNQKFYNSFIRMEQVVSCGFIPNLFEENDKQFCINKDITARLSLFWSSSYRTSIKPDYLVLPEAVYKRVESIRTIENNELVIKENYEHEVTAFDGCGICHPTMMQKVAKELALDHIPYFMGVRSIKLALKGLLVSVDFIKYFEEMFKDNMEYIEKRCDGFYVKDVWNNWIRINENTIIINPTMAKWSGFLNLEQYESIRPVEYSDFMDCLYITKTNKKENNKMIRTNYQLLLQLALNLEDYSSLVKPTEYFLRGVLYQNKACVLKFLGAVEIDDESEEICLEDKLSYLLGLDYDKFIKLPWIKKSLALMVERSIKELISGKFYIKGNYKTIVQAPLGILNFAMNRNIDDELNEHEFWCNCEDEKALIARNPIASFSEIQDITLVQSDLYKNYFGHWKDELLVFNAKDITASIMSGADMDGDFVAYTTNEILRSAIIPPEDGIHFINTSNTKGAKIKYNGTNRTDCQLDYMGNLIGEVANINGAISNLAQDSGCYINTENITLKSYCGNDREITQELIKEFNDKFSPCDSYTNNLPREEFKEVIKNQFYSLQKEIYNTVHLSMTAIDAPKTMVKPDLTSFKETKSKYKFPKFFQALPDKQYYNFTIEWYTWSVMDSYWNYQSFTEYGVMKICKDIKNKATWKNGKTFGALFDITNLFDVDYSEVDNSYEEVSKLFNIFKDEFNDIFQKVKKNKSYYNAEIDDYVEDCFEYERDSEGKIVYCYKYEELAREVKFKELMHNIEEKVLSINSQYSVEVLSVAINLLLTNCNNNYLDKFICDFFFNTIETVVPFKYKEVEILSEIDDSGEVELLFSKYNYKKKVIAESNIGLKELDRFANKDKVKVEINNIKVGLTKENEVKLEDVEYVVVNLEDVNVFVITTDKGIKLGKVFDTCPHRKTLYGLLGVKISIDNSNSKVSNKSYNLILKDVLIGRD